MRRRSFATTLLALPALTALAPSFAPGAARAQNRPWLEKEVGQIGVLVVNKDSGEAGYFRPYMEQRLRRMPEYDTPTKWAWWLDDGLFVGDGLLFVKAGLVPGVDGNVIDDETEPVTLQVPPEFFDLCAEYELTPEEALRGFIADACGLMNYIANPREDGYSSNGSDERDMAAGYLERAYAPRRYRD